MKISTKGRYALRLLLDLAQHYGQGYLPLKDVSQRQNVSLKYLEQIITLLAKDNILLSQRGAQGGYMLAKKPAEYKIGDILRITEGSLAPVACLETADNICTRKENCTTLKFWSGLYKVITEYADSKTLQDLINENSDGGSYII